MSANCPVKVNGSHFIEWMEVPGSSHFGDLETINTPGYSRGICLDCGDQFTK